MSKKLLYIYVFLSTIIVYSQGEIGETITIDNIIYTITSNAPNKVEVKTQTKNANNNLVIPESISYKKTLYNVTSIAIDAFFEKKLKSVSIPNSITYIGDYAFANNYLTNLNLPNSIKSVGHYVFANNDITSVTISENLTKISYKMFDNNKLTSVIIPNGVVSIIEYSFSNNLLTSITFPSSLEYISHESFKNNKLVSITIPKSVTMIKKGAFAQNPLTEIISEGIKPAAITGQFPYEWGMPFGDNSNIALTIPSGTLDDYINSNWVGFKSIKEDFTLSTNNFNINEDFTLEVNKDYIIINTNKTSSLNSYSIYNLLGSRLLKGKSTKEANQIIPIDRLTTGIYIITLEFDNGIASRKFIKK